MYCGKCGNELKGTEKYCPKCGMRLECDEPVIKSEMSVQKERFIPKKKNKKKRILLVCIFLLFAGLVICVFLKKDEWNGMASEPLSFEGIKEQAISWGEEIRDRIDIPIPWSKTETVYRVSKSTTYDAEGNVVEWVEREYNEQGNFVSGKEYDASDCLKCLYEYEYGAHGYASKYTYNDLDNSMFLSYVWEYDSLGNKSNKISYDKDGNSEGRTEYKYDDKGNLIKEINYNVDGIIESWEEYEYDSRGNLIQEVVFPNDGAAICIYEYEYDSQDNCIRETNQVVCDTSYMDVYGVSMEWNEKDEHGYVKIWSENEYDKEGQVVKTTYYSLNGSIKCYCQHEYNENNCIEKVTVYDGQNNLLGWEEYEIIKMEIEKKRN